jgi:hypothetical protein
MHRGNHNRGGIDLMKQLPVIEKGFGLVTRRHGLRLL